jgi:glycosyltransferase involved in cell wall biosynthesis
MKKLKFFDMRISVFITSYNQKHYLIEAIESVLAQTLTPSQIVVVDDASTDGSREVIRGYKSRYPELIEAIFHARNQGVSAARNDALRAVTGDYVSFLDGDDKFLPAKLEKEAKLLAQNPEARIAYSNYYRIAESGLRYGVWAEEPLPQGNIFRQIITRDFSRSTFFQRMLVHHQTWREAGFYDLNLPRGQDYEMSFRLAKRGLAVYCHEPLSEYRKDKDRPSRGLPPAEQFARSVYIYGKNLHLLDDLNEAERSDIKQKIYKIMKKQAKRAAEKIRKAGRFSKDSQQAASAYYGQALETISSLLGICIQPKLEKSFKNF